MNHYTWTYLGDGGRNYRVGLMHSAKTGHLLIYIGSKIVQVDFKVLESKEYTFFIEEELVHINLERRGDEMFFTFNIDKKADTPRNRVRHALERKHFVHILISLGVLGLIVTSLLLWGKNAKKSEGQRIEEMLAKGSQETVGRVLIKKLEGGKSEVSYQFVVGTQTVTSEAQLFDEPLILLVNPFPLEHGDEFWVRYSPQRPTTCEMRYDKPSPRQIAAYLRRAAAKHDELNPGAPPGLTICFVKTAYEHGALDALADIYFQGAEPSANAGNNSGTFARLTADRGFLAKLEASCGHLKPPK